MLLTDLNEFNYGMDFILDYLCIMLFHRSPVCHHYVVR